ncbi:TauD/TfdA family dioxygenase [Natrialba taiwanensis]|uniref:TauD/TfdA family dioxygenase n=1 Tax=Natrialba taiwanensis TaxID=160846 RepID=UPI000A00C7AC|nr:TauD/TfdA family dioxygenase [Natrialba taiwanensis]
MEISDLSNIDLDPVCHAQYNQSVTKKADIGKFDPSSDGFKQSVLYTYRELGFAKMTIGDINQPRKELAKVAQEFGFDSAFVPSSYSNDRSLHDEFGINQIGGGKNTGGNHEGFFSNEEQAVHVDGTLEPIGTIPTTMMLCRSQAESGGESRIFNSVSAFCQLAREQPTLANALSSEQALTRSDVDRSGTSVTGPAFDINRYGLVNRFSLDNTSEWNVNEVEHLQAALNWMNDKLENSSKFYTEFNLNSGDLLIVANHKISHGRNGYKDKKNNRRQLFRAIFDSEIK